MHIWVDADACPVVIKEMLFRVAERLKLPLTLVANRLLRVPPSPYIKAMQVPMGFDVADNLIVARAAADDLVITADIPLAAALVEKGVMVLNPRGELYSIENMREKLSLRDFSEALRGTGVDIAGPAAFSQSDRQAFARQLDRIMARRRP